MQQQQRRHAVVAAAAKEVVVPSTPLRFSLSSSVTTGNACCARRAVRLLLRGPESRSVDVGGCIACTLTKACFKVEDFRGDRTL